MIDTEDQVSKPSSGSDTKSDAAVPTLLNADGSPYEIPVEGSLGLLAIGYAGIMLWRQKRSASTSGKPTN